MPDKPFTKENLDTRARQYEADNKDSLLEYQEEKPGVINGANVDDVIEALRRKKQ